MFSSNRFITIKNSNPLKTGDKLTITSSVTKDIYIRRCISLIRYHTQIYTSFKSALFTFTLVVWNTVFLIKIYDWKDFMFQNEKFLGFEHPYNLFEYFQNKGIDSNSNLQKRQNTNGSIKEQPFFSRGSKNYILRTKKRKKVPVCGMLEFSRSLSSSMLPILS